MKMYEPDLKHIKKQWAKIDAPLEPLVLPKELPQVLLDYGYSIRRGILYYDNFPVGGMGTRGLLKHFKDYPGFSPRTEGEAT